MFWTFIYSICALLIVISLRELVVLSRMEKAHPDRGLYWFNTLLLLMLAAAILGVGFYLDSRRGIIEAYVPAYPSAVFAPDRSILKGGTVWLYTTDDLPADIERFYRAYAERSGRNIIVDPHDILKLRIGSAGEPVFITVTDEGGVRVLSYTFDGEVKIAE
jgi:hypothetical protein